MGIPVKLIGVGEKIDDLQPFNSRDFVRALFEGTSQTVQTEEENENEHKKIILASNNKGKIREIQEILSPLGYEIISMKDSE